MTDKKQGGVLKGWVRQDKGDGTQYLTGVIYNDPRFKDGDPIATSAIIDIHWDEVQGDIAETENTIYILGDPNESL